MNFESPTIELDFYDEDALFDRLTSGLEDESRQVVFVVGSALTAPSTPGAPGVPNVTGVIELIASQFDGTSRQHFDAAISSAPNPYQAAFKFLIGRKGQKAANGVIKMAVAQARPPAPTNIDKSVYSISASTSDDACRAFDNDSSGWLLTPGVDALGRLAASKTELFGRMVVTTNFDPLIGAAIARYDGHSFRTFLHRDGSLSQADGSGTHLVHLHGYWYGSDTLHTPRQLTQARPQLRSSLAQLIRGNIFVVLAYGGWDDAFTQALMDVVVDDSSYPEVIWCFYGDQPNLTPDLMSALGPGIDRARVNLYAGIDVHRFLPRLADAWNAPATTSIAQPAPCDGHPATSQEAVAPLPAEQPSSKLNLARLARADQDRPPVVDILVGRGPELAALQVAKFKVGFVTGLGGEGKSQLVASYFGSREVVQTYTYRIWRDCREQSAKFEDQITSLIEGLSTTDVNAAELAKRPTEELAELFVDLTKGHSFLVVFDNVDHYVDLETNELTGTLGRFITRFTQLTSLSQIILTCRPPVQYTMDDYFSLGLSGLPLPATKELFLLRKATSDEKTVERAHELTDGHAMWLDLLAARAALKGKEANLADMLDSISRGTGSIPDAMLRSTWVELREREKVVLQALAETLRPTNALEISEYVRSSLNYKNVSKALMLLRGLSLVVLKEDLEGGDAFELHPLIRAFIQKTFPRSERKSIINAILKTYLAFFGLHRSQLKSQPTTNAVSKWLEGAELCINAERYVEALECLFDVGMPIRRQEPPSEFVRIASGLFQADIFSELVGEPYFEEVFENYVSLIVHIGDIDSASEALARYRLTIDGKSARYIQYCSLQCYLYWMTGNYDIAVQWGQEGEDLRATSHVDTTFSAAHNLALAQRDSGAVDNALAYFLQGASMDEVIDPSIVDLDRGAAFYGNIGRCLHLMGQIDPAIAVYRKSAKLIQTQYGDAHTENQAYIRQWIGELLFRRGENDLALNFLEAAYFKWLVVSPLKADKLIRKIYADYSEWRMPDETPALERKVLQWILA